MKSLIKLENTSKGYKRGNLEVKALNNKEVLKKIFLLTL